MGDRCTATKRVVGVGVSGAAVGNVGKLTVHLAVQPVAEILLAAAERRRRLWGSRVVDATTGMAASDIGVFVLRPMALCEAVDQ